MSPSRLGARKAAGRRLVEQGVVRSIEEYLSFRADGLLWCADCREWHFREMLGRDAGRYGGRAGRCRKKGRVARDGREV